MTRPFRNIIRIILLTALSGYALSARADVDPAFAAFNDQVTVRILERLQVEGIELAPAGQDMRCDGRTPEHETHEKHDAGHAPHEPAHAAPGHSTHRT